jgi:metallo-beta-lactamase family protein
MAKISFYGGVGSVTGSKYLLESNGRKVLVDCGLFQGDKELRERNWQDPPFKPSEIDAVLITHAHIDHTGYLPRLVKLGFTGRVFTSRATADLMKILLLDSAHLQAEEADYRNRHNLTSHKPALPLYDEADARETFKLLNPVPNTGEAHEIADGMTASFRVAGHIIGASMVLVEMKNARQNGESIRFLFSGDLGHYQQPIISDPAPPPACDYLMCESTYGDRLHGEVTSEDKFAEIINAAYQRNAPILIPAFAVGRTQEILYLIRELEDKQVIASMPVIVDSPMAARATEIYNRFSEEHDEEYASILAKKVNPLLPDKMIIAASREQSKQLNSMKGARIIISASGMLTGGRVLHHALRVLPDEDATLVFVGYQAAGTLGRRIQSGEREVRVMKQWLPVRCHIENVSEFSAHADWKTVLRWLSGLPNTPRAVFTTHGEPDAAAAMAGHIHDEYGWQVIVPQYRQTIELE